MPTTSFTNATPADAATTQLSVHDLQRFVDCTWEFCCTVSDLTTEDHRGRTSAFHSVSEPTLRLSDYVTIIAKRHKLSRSTLLIALLYVGRYARASQRLPSCLAVHRLVAAAIVTACKAHGDVSIRNADLAVSTGLDKSELMDLEVAFVTGMKFDLYVSGREYAAFVEAFSVASALRLRSDITVGVAAALGVLPPARPPPLHSLPSSRSSFLRGGLSSPRQRDESPASDAGLLLLPAPLVFDDQANSGLLKSPTYLSSACTTDDSDFATHSSSGGSFAGTRTPGRTLSSSARAAGGATSAVRQIRSNRSLRSSRPDPTAAFATPEHRSTLLPTFVPVLNLDDDGGSGDGAPLPHAAVPSPGQPMLSARHSVRVGRAIPPR